LIAISTTPDRATIVALLSRYTRQPTQAHIDTVIRVIKYLKGTKPLSPTYSLDSNKTLLSFANFPIESDMVTALSDAN